jgi:chromosomal replication initiation ATPase DnaA
MKIKIISTEVVNKGKWNQVEVTYKNLSTDKIELKNIVSFSNKDVYNTLKDSNKNDIFDVKAEKNDKGYWEWTAVTVGVDTPEDVTAKKETGGTPYKSTYETPEERALKQVYIIRQSSIASAIALLKNDKKATTSSEVLALAKEFENFVFGNSNTIVPLAELPIVDGDLDL